MDSTLTPGRSNTVGMPERLLTARTPASPMATPGRGVLMMVVTPRHDLPDTESEPETPREWFDTYFEIITADSVEDAQYESIYGFGSASGLRERLGWIRDTQRQLGLQTPELDFAFVGMARNLGQLEGVMALAQTFAITQLDIHPVIRRDPIPETFPEELDDKNRLKKTFLDRLANEVERLKTEFPGLQVNYSTPEPKPQHTLDHCARPYPLP